MTTGQMLRGARFRSLHEQDAVFVMPNAWDAGSARLIAAAGFEAMATTSAGVTFSMGLPDYEYRVERDVMLGAFEAVAMAVDIPVSGDLEAGYGDDPETVAETISLSIECGMVGGNIEDHTGDRSTPLYDLDLAVERIRAARAAADATKLTYTLTARADNYLVDDPNAFSESVKRANLYREAGADCLFVPGVKDAAGISALVREIDGPMNVVMGLAGDSLTVAQLSDLGVKRISVGGSIARAALTAVRNAALEIRKSGSFHYADQAIPDKALSQFFASF